jgi:two-component system LytT family response regulator
MDIELPGMTGFDILERIHPIHFNIIFTTAHSQYGIKAIQFSAIDYLLKPIDIEELKLSVARANTLLSNNQSLERIKILLENIQHLNANDPFNRIALPTNDGLRFVYTNEIVRCMSSNNYTHIFLKDGQKILISKTLKDIENVFSSHTFFRVHNSHLVNTTYIKKFIKSDVNMVVMTDGAEVEVSRRKKDELLKMLNL